MYKWMVWDLVFQDKLRERPEGKKRPREEMNDTYKEGKCSAYDTAIASRRTRVTIKFQEITKRL